MASSAPQLDSMTEFAALLETMRTTGAYLITPVLSSRLLTELINDLKLLAYIRTMAREYSSWHPRINDLLAAGTPPTQLAPDTCGRNYAKGARCGRAKGHVGNCRQYEVKG